MACLLVKQNDHPRLFRLASALERTYICNVFDSRGSAGLRD